MKKLLQGLEKFQSGYFSSHSELFEQLSHGQKPRVLVIACSDSRVDPNLITQAQVGDLFVIRNAGNIIPPYGAANGGEGAAIEYAIHALDIEQVIVCGHSHCGAMKGLLKMDKLAKEMPLVYDWLKHAEATRRLIQENYGDIKGDELLEVTIAENVVTQLENLKTYPIVRSRLHQNRLTLFGWVYEIETGEVLMYDAESDTYVAPFSRLPDSYYSDIQSQRSAQPIQIHRDTSPTPQPTPQAAPSRRILFPTANLSPEQADRIYRGSGAR
jgi:carbonic anhydrase